MTLARASLTGLIAFTLSAMAARAEVVVRSLGETPLTLSPSGEEGAEIDGGKGAVLRVGKSTIVVNGGQMTLGDAFHERDDGRMTLADPLDDAIAGNLTMNFVISPPPPGAPNQRMTTMMQRLWTLEVATSHGCDAIKAAFGVGCHMGGFRSGVVLRQGTRAVPNGAAHLAAGFDVESPWSAKPTP